MSDLTINCRKSVDVQSHISSELLKGLGIDKRRGRRDDMISIESYQIESQLESMDFHINNIFYPESVSGPEHSDGSHWLGSYSSMQSPGTITFNLNNLKGFYGHLILELQKSHLILKISSLEELATAVFKKTLYHELFHHYADFVRIFTDHRSQYDYEIEEALAVACSRYFLNEELKSTKLNKDFLDSAYQYRSRGYCDWVKYELEYELKEKVIQYSGYPSVLTVPDNKVNIFQVSWDYLTSIFDHPHVEFSIQ